MDNKTRLNWIDWAKSIGIFLVVLCHTPQYSTFENLFFCSFQMPLFFILSGYLHTNSNTFGNAVKKYWNTLIIPYLLFQVVFYPYWYIVQRYDGHNVSTLYTALIEPVLRCLIGIPINAVTWFLIALLIIKLYANIILSKKYSLELTLISCIIAIATRYFMYMHNDAVKISYAIDSMIIFLPFFFLGYFTKKYSILPRILNRKWKLYLVVTITLLASCTLLMTECKNYTYILLLFYLKGISGSLGILCLCMILNNIKLNIVYTISNGTILIFGIHWMFIGSFNFFLKRILEIHGEIHYSTPIALLIAGGIVWINYYLILICKKHFPIILGYRK